MTNFIIGMLAGMATVGIIIIIVDQLRTRGYSTNPIEILGGVLLWFWDTMNHLAKRGAEWSVKRKYPYEKDEFIDEKRIEAEDAVYEIVEDLLDDEEMEFIDNMVDYCEGKVI